MITGKTATIIFAGTKDKGKKILIDDEIFFNDTLNYILQEYGDNPMFIGFTVEGSPIRYHYNTRIMTKNEFLYAGYGEIVPVNKKHFLSSMKSDSLLLVWPNNGFRKTILNENDVIL